MTISQEMTDGSRWIWLTSEQMEFPLRSEVVNENHGEPLIEGLCAQIHVNLS